MAKSNFLSRNPALLLLLATIIGGGVDAFQSAGIRPSFRSASFLLGDFSSNYGQSTSCAVFTPSLPSSWQSYRATRLWGALPENNQQDEEMGGRSLLRLKASSSSTDPGGPSEIEFDIKTAIALVGGQSLIVLAAVIVAYFVKTPLLGLGNGFVFDSVEAWKYGVAATVPLGVLAVVLDGFEESVPALKKVTKATQRSVLTLLGGRFLPLTGFLTATALGIAAGVGEEWLFRGVMQTELVERVFTQANVAPAVVFSSLIFGALHAVTPLYAILATLASLYFGFLYIWTDNLAIPMICHAVYDIGALYYAHWTVAKDLTLEQRNDLLRMPL